mmetsp:Transcript_8885/g.34842  ORF Transcript_8885/g.34842 Transcript_8885/m.34842 type:complete len:216 (+) Transcript_8885:921-1568(+)
MAATCLSVSNTPNNAPAPTPPITRTNPSLSALTHFSLHRGGNGSGAHARIHAPGSHVMRCASVPSSASVPPPRSRPRASNLDDRVSARSTARVRRAMSCAWSRWSCLRSAAGDSPVDVIAASTMGPRRSTVNSCGRRGGRAPSPPLARAVDPSQPTDRSASPSSPTKATIAESAAVNPASESSPPYLDHRGFPASLTMNRCLLRLSQVGCESNSW